MKLTFRNNWLSVIFEYLVCREFEKTHLWKLWGEKSCRKASIVIPHLRCIPCSEYSLREWALENEEELVITWIAQSSALLLRLSHTSPQEGQVRTAHLLTRWGLINYLHKEIQCHGKDSKRLLKVYIERSPPPPNAIEPLPLTCPSLRCLHLTFAKCAAACFLSMI